MQAVFYAFLIAWTAIPGTPARAAGDAMAVAGLIAGKCTSCHEVPGYKARRTRAGLGAPSFAKTAKSPDIYSPDRLRAFLRKPHWPMTQFILSSRDIENILAFIDRLR
jgi:cytochrome c553